MFALWNRKEFGNKPMLVTLLQFDGDICLILLRPEVWFWVDVSDLS